MIRTLFNIVFVIMLDAVLMFYLPYLGNFIGLSEDNTNKLYLLIMLVTTIYCVYEYVVPSSDNTDNWYLPIDIVVLIWYNMINILVMLVYKWGDRIDESF